MKKIAGVLPVGVLEQHVAVLGKTRSGKSSVMRGIVEHILDHQKPVCIVDPKGDWWGIKLAADGKSAGFPVVIFGNGPHADVPINEHSGAVVGELWATGNRSCLIDLGGWTVSARTQFWIDFASAVFKHTLGDRWLVVDEVHNFAPKGSLKGTEGRMPTSLHWANRLASEGLGKGVHMIFASQRPQKVHNDTLTSAETLIAMRVLHPSDRGAVSEWIKGCGDSAGDEVLDSLAQLKRGEGWAWSPEINFGPTRVQFPMFRTYDSFRAQTVEDARRLKGWAEVDLDEVRTKLGKVVEEAKANDPRELKKTIAAKDQRIKELERSAQNYSANTTSHEKAVPALTDADRALLTKIEGKLVLIDVKAGEIASAVEQRATRLIKDALDEYTTATRNVGVESAKLVADILEQVSVKKLLEKLNGLAVTPVPEKPANQSRQILQPVRQPLRTPASYTLESPPVSPSVGDSNGTLGKVHRAFLTVLANRQGKLTKRNQLAVFSGYSSKSRHVDNTISALRTMGYLTGSSDGMAITQEGIDALGHYETLPEGRALVEYWIREAGTAPGAMLRVLTEVYPNTMARDQVAEASNYSPTSRHVDNSLSYLRTLELIDGDRSALRASEDLMEGA